MAHTCLDCNGPCDCLGGDASQEHCLGCGCWADDDDGWDDDDFDDEAPE